jgi:ribonuclease P protein component
LFERILRVGRRLEGSRVQLIVAPAALLPGQVGYVIGAKQLPRAVDRNRLRRVLREALRARRAALSGLDIVLRLRRPCAPTEVAAVASEAAMLLDRLEHTPGR